MRANANLTGDGMSESQKRNDAWPGDRGSTNAPDPTNAPYTTYRWMPQGHQSIGSTSAPLSPEFSTRTHSGSYARFFSVSSASPPGAIRKPFSETAGRIVKHGDNCRQQVTRQRPNRVHWQGQTRTYIIHQIWSHWHILPWSPRPRNFI